jgi:aminocarboxymuconate-semialdehyde decarboxylase
VLGYMFDSSVAALRLVLSEIVSELPDLTVVHPHCGATLPYLAGRLDTSHSKPYSLGRELEPRPSAQLARFYTDTMSQSRDTLAYALGFYEEGHVVFGSDYPYFEPPAELAFVREALAGDEREQDVLHGNAARLFRLA